MRLRNGRYALMLSALLLAALVVPAEANVAVQAPVRGDGQIDGMEVVADGLDNPRGLDVAGDGTVYVAEAGRGGDGPCIEGPGGPEICYGRSGAVTRVKNGRQQRIIDHLPSLAQADGIEALGTSDVLVRGGKRLFVTVGLGRNPRVRDQLGPDGDRLARVYRYNGRRLRVVADVGDYEIRVNPDGGLIDTNGTSLTRAHGRTVLADAGGNALLQLRGRRRVRALAVFENRPAPAPEFLGLPPGTAIPMQAVPTSVAEGPDGSFYVGQLTGFPFPERGARVYRVPRGGGEPEIAVDGFTNIIDLDVADDGTLYVLEIARDSLLSPDRTGALWRVHPDGTRELIASEGLTYPTGVSVGPNGALYVSNCGNCSGPGQVLRLEAETRDSYAIPGENVFPEGVAYDPESRDFFVSSTGTGAIFRADVRDRTMREFLPGGSDDRTTTIGLAVDAAGRLLVAGGETGKVWVYDTVSGDLLTSSDNGRETTFLNDVVVAPNGDAYVTDSFDPVLYRLPRTDDGYGQLEPFLDLSGSVVEYAEGFNFNGIVATPDGRYVVAVQSNSGQLFRIDLHTKGVRAVAQNGVAIDGDGLALDGLDLFAVSNGEVLRTRFTSDFLTIGPITQRISRPDFDSPTTIALVDDRLLVVQSQFDARFGDDEVHLPFMVTTVRIAP